MSYQQNLEQELQSQASKRPKKKAKVQRLAKLDKYHNRLLTGK